MYVTGTSGQEINEYTLTTAFDVSTASYRDRFAVGHAPMSVKFNDDGTIGDCGNTTTIPSVNIIKLTKIRI